MAESLQARLGYEAFLAGARLGPAAFAADVAGWGTPVTAGAVADAKGAPSAPR